MNTYRTCKFLFPVLMALILFGCNSSSDSKEVNNGSKVAISGPDKASEVSGAVAEEEMRQAALDGDLELVKKMLEADTDINAMDQEGHTALMFAAFNGHTEIVLALIDGGAVVDRRDLLGRTALLYAATGPFPETVKALLDKGAEPNIIDSDEHFTPLMHAAAEGNLDVVKLLLEYGADHTLIDVDSDNAESFARRAEHIQVADYLHSLK